MARKKEKPQLDYAKLHDSVMNNIESILSMYDFEWSEYSNRKSYDNASTALFDFFKDLSENPENKEAEE